MTAVNDVGRVGAKLSEPNRWWAVTGVAGASSIVSAQPVYEVLARSPEFFVVRRSSPISVILFALGLLAPGLLLGLVVGLVGARSGPRRRIALSVALAVIAALLVLQLGVRIQVGLWWSSAAALGSAAFVSFAVFKFAGLRWFVSLLSFAPPVFLSAFLIQMPIAELGTPPPTITAPNELKNTVVFIVFDEFPTLSLLDANGAIDQSRFPNFARLAATSTWYRNAFTLEMQTPQAVPAILSGGRSQGRLPHFSDYPQNLFSVLGVPGSVIYEPFTNLCPVTLCPESPTSTGRESGASLTSIASRVWGALTLGLEDEDQDPFGELGGIGGLQDDQLLQRLNESTRTGPAEVFDRFVQSVRPAKLNFIHSILPHGPFRYYPDGTQYNDFERLDGFDGGSWVESEQAWPLLARQRHLLQLAYVDALLGSLLDRLRMEGWLEDALLVITADHGIAFTEGESLRGPADEVVPEVAMVPLFMKLPGQIKGTVDPRVVFTIDVLPTIADAIGIRIPLPTEGHSFLDPSYKADFDLLGARRGQELLEDPESALSRLAAKWASIFPLPGVSGLYKQRPFEELIGGSLEESLFLQSGLAPEATLDQDWLLLNVSSSSGFAPGFISGEVKATFASGMAVAAIEDRKILAIAPIALGHDGLSRFATLIDPEFLSDGPHRLSLYLVNVDQATAQRMDYTGPALFELDEAAGQIVEIDSGAYQIVQPGGGLRGYVESVDWNPLHIDTQAMYAIGWAVDDNRGLASDLIVVFLDGRFAGSVVPDLDLRNRLAPIAGSQVSANSFNVNVPYMLQGVTHRLRIFALWGDVALELPMQDTVVARLQEVSG